MIALSERTEKALRVSIGKRLAARIEWADTTREELALALGMTEAKLARVLKGSSSLTAEQIAWCARALGCNIADLVP